MIDRRTLLRWVGQGAALASLGTLTTGCPYSKSPASGPIPAGNVRSVPVGHFAFVQGKPVILARDEGGLYALSAICTHWGCDMESDGKVVDVGVRCGCHGSRFDKNGKVLEGPASEPLTHFKVDVGPSGDIVVDAGTKVPEGTRTPVSADVAGTPGA